MWIFQSVYGGNGFFNFDISFFEGLAAANNLSVVYSCYLVQTSEYEQFIIPCSKDLFNALDLTKIKNVGITYIFRKNSLADFKYYYQYNYNNNQSPFEIMYINNELQPEKIYVPTKTIQQIKKSAKKGVKSSIDWLRALGYKF